MENSSLNWQDSLNTQLLQRLVLLGQQPGIIKQDIGQKIIDRCDRFLNRLPLLSQYLQRWQGINEMSVDSVPIVYALPPLQESGNNERITVNQVNHLASNTDKIIQTKTESSQPLSAPIHLMELPLVNNVESLQAIASSSTPIPSKSGSKTQYKIVHPLSIIDNFSSSNQTYSFMNNVLRKENPLPIAKIINKNSNYSDRENLIVNPLLYENSSKLLSQNKSIQERPLNRPISSTNSSFVDYSENTKRIFSRFSEETITKDSLVQTMLLEKKKFKLPVVKISNQSLSEKIKDQLPMPPSSSSKMPRINATTIGDRSAIATPLPLAARSPSLSGSSSFDVPRRSPQQSPEIPKVFAAPFPPTETRISPMQTAPPKVDLEAIAYQVERKIMRRLVIESERRGQKR